jgi:hypothetical protein
MKKLNLEQMADVNGAKQWTLGLEIECGLLNVGAIVSLGCLNVWGVVSFVYSAYKAGCYEAAEGIPY